MSLELTFPETAGALFAEAEKNAAARYLMYKKMAEGETPARSISRLKSRLRNSLRNSLRKRK